MARGPTPAQLAAARAQAGQYASQGRAVAKVAHQQRAQRVAAQQVSQQKRATRVAVSAQRRRTGGPAPILVRRREKVARVQRIAETPTAPGGTQAKARGPVRLHGPQPITSHPRPAEAKIIRQAAIEKAAKSKDVIFSRDPEVLKAAGFKKAGLGEKLAAAPLSAVGHAPADIAELATTTPSSIARLATTAVTHYKKVPGMLAAPYKQFAKDPSKFATERPVTSALMFAPSIKVPGLAAGRIARLAGKQTLERPTATLAGTTLRQQRIGSRSYFKRAAQAREDAGLPPRAIRQVSPTDVARKAVGKQRPTGPEPRISHSQIRTRVDEFYDRTKYHRADVERSALKQAKKRYAHLPKAERKLATADHLRLAQEGASQEIERRFGREFGSHWQVGEKGTVLKPKQATEGHLHESPADAKKIAERVPFEAQIREAGPGKQTVVPKVAHDRLVK